MKIILKLILMVIICSFSYSAPAQKSIRHPELNQTYSKGKIYIQGQYPPVKALKITLLNDSILSFINKETGAQESVNVYTTSVNRLKLKTGTKAGEYAIYGGITPYYCNDGGVGMSVKVVF